MDEELADIIQHSNIPIGIRHVIAEAQKKLVKLAATVVSLRTHINKFKTGTLPKTLIPRPQRVVLPGASPEAMVTVNTNMRNIMVQAFIAQAEMLVVQTQLILQQVLASRMDILQEVYTVWESASRDPAMTASVPFNVIAAVDAELRNLLDFLSNAWFNYQLSKRQRSADLKTMSRVVASVQQERVQDRLQAAVEQPDAPELRDVIRQEVERVSKPKPKPKRKPKAKAKAKAKQPPSPPPKQGKGRGRSKNHKGGRKGSKVARKPNKNQQQARGGKQNSSH